MGEQLSELFVPLTSLPGLYHLPPDSLEPNFIPEDNFSPTFGGVCQLLFFALVYASILFKGSQMIAKGSDLLLLIPEFSSIVGSVVIPVLGAVPDGAIVLFSGLGPKAKVQKQLSVGVGALAGSTIMLLTVSWVLSLVSGRVSISEKGFCNYQRPSNAHVNWQKLNPQQQKPFSLTGVEPDAPTMNAGANMMMATAFGYIIIQGAAFAFSGESNEDIAQREQLFSLAGFLYCFALFFVYIYRELKKSNSNNVMKDRVDQKRVDAILDSHLSLQALFHDQIMEESTRENHGLLEHQTQKVRFTRIVRRFFNKYDPEKKGAIDAHTMQQILTDLHMSHSKEHCHDLMLKLDTNDNDELEFKEFAQYIKNVINASDGENEVEIVFDNGKPDAEFHRDSRRQRPNKEGASCPHHDVEDENMPPDLSKLPANQQRKQLIFRSFRMMLVGTFLILVFSDPMVDVLSEMGDVVGISPFYISFMFAPLASNASELIASYTYAARKTRKTITISLSALEGAAIMNNTLGLGIFLALVFFRELRWSFSAETISILCVEFAMYFVATKKIQTLGLAVFVAVLFPLSILYVAFLKKGLGLD